MYAHIRYIHTYIYTCAFAPIVLTYTHAANKGDHVECSSLFIFWWITNNPQQQMCQSKMMMLIPRLSSVNVSYIPCVSYMFLQNVWNSIKRGKKTWKSKLHNFITCARLTGICFFTLYVVSNIFSQKYKTYKGHRTHELTTHVSSCVRYQICVLYFTNTNCQKIFGQDKRKIRALGWGYCG